MAVSVMFVGCGDTTNTEETTVPNETTLKFGSGLYVTAPSVTDATEDKDGSGKLDVTVAAVTVDAEGKIVSCALDTSSNTVNFTADGKAVAKDEFKTKYEQGNDYNMVAYGGATKEWHEQVAAFDAACVGKTASEIATLVAEDGKGAPDLQTAGCTIIVSGFVKAASKI